jgi:uncharacterized membrane protein YfcA
LSYAVVVTTAFIASALTFFSGFGLGTLLLPAFALFVPIEQAIAVTAVVHFLNGLFKVGLVGRHADRGVLVRFGIPAMLAALAGAWLLVGLADAGPLATYSLLGRVVEVTPVKLVIGVVLFGFAAAEVVPTSRELGFGPRLLPVGGALSGFFGGLSGMQGALRSAFLARVGLSKDGFIATGAVIATAIDVTRLGVYVPAVLAQAPHLDRVMLGGAVLAAFGGAFAGNRFLRGMTMRAVRGIVAGMLFAVAAGLITGVL